MLDLSIDAVDLTPTVASLLLLHPLFTSTEGLPVAKTRQIWNAAGFYLRRLNTGAELVPVSLKRAFLARGVDVCVDYGPSETTVGVVSSLMTAEFFSENAPLDDIGRPTGSNEVYLLDENTQLVPFGAVGELCIGGAQVSPGYLDEKLNRSVFVEVDTLGSEGEEGSRIIYRTGDLARYLPQGTEGYGSIQYLGRKDCQVKVSGVRIELGEVECQLNRLVKHPDLRQILVDQTESEAGLVGFLHFYPHCTRLRPSPTEVENIQILIPTKPGWFESILESIHSSISDHLPGPMVPRSWMIISAIPLQVSGKTDRKLLKRLWQAHHQNPCPNSLASPAPRPTLDQVEEVASLAWRTALGLPIGYVLKLTDEFVRMGGDSIGLMKLVSEARRQGFSLAYGPLTSFGDFLDSLRRASNLRPSDSGVPYEPFELVNGPTRALWQAHLSDEHGILPETIEDLLPSSPAQVAILSCSIGTDLYYAQAVYNLDDLPGPPQAVAARLTALVKRHGMLRTRFFLPPSGTSIIQCILKPEHEQVAVEIIKVDDSASLENVIDSFIEQQRLAHRVHAWGQANVELRLFSQSGKFRLVWSMHHAISDGWTLDLLLHELASPSPLTTPVPNYGEFVKAWLVLAEDQEGEKHWRNVLSRTTPIRWPTSVCAPFRTELHVSGRWHTHGRLVTLGRVSGFTPALVGRVACAVGLAHWLGCTSSSEILMGVVRSGREIELGGGAMAEELRGCCVSVWPSVIGYERGQNLTELLKAERTAERVGRRVGGLGRVGGGAIEVLYTFQTGAGMGRGPERVRMPTRFAVSFEITPVIEDTKEVELQIEIYLDARFGTLEGERLVKEVVEALERVVQESGNGIGEEEEEEVLGEDRNDDAQVLRTSWAGVLGVDEFVVRAGSKFRNLGGDSIHLMRLVHRLGGLGYVIDGHEIGSWEDACFEQMVGRMRKV
ncbi:hypothetical protein CROQUDRAFT_587064 [Cronartium quercuum f. sp. fusiforme G11]|uniref:Carrier domain-containing protein n=1 Tax=Cronartium quercuum f. sp. fusiforme G11 TaxID=708437 RepID=A0A9P6TAF0_9BASI|nr:hypothetical protein CROQUDRAFT_587064 [Cronartium quercuum f. sp. fusiforme G11]